MSTGADLIRRVEERRRSVACALAPKRRSQFGQFFTPAPVATFLAELLELPAAGTLRLLDPGAGVGSLCAAVVERVIRERPELELRLVAFEVDEQLIAPLRQTLEDCEAAGGASGVNVTADVRAENFVTWGTDVLAGSMLVAQESFDACVMNPPYRKVNVDGADRAALERIGLRVTNLYPGFLAIAAALLEAGGQLSAITPRSFANGPYFEPFRQFFLARMALDRLHVYEHRGRVFADADVLQENVVLKATKGGARQAVVLSSSASQEDEPELRTVPYQDVVRPGDRHQFVHIPVADADAAIAEWMSAMPATLADLGVEVSTGRVVDFRAREHLRQSPEQGTVPLIYPTHLRAAGIEWPLLDAKKPNALVASEVTASLLLPNETYALVKRFTAKEEPRRVVAALCEPDDLPGETVAFENHLNVYHRGGRGLDPELAAGLVAFLNTTPVDQYVRQFNGHTQINATDLRGLRYPAIAQLVDIGRELRGLAWPDQDELDACVADRLHRSAAPTRFATAA